jgi:MoxR-like ATPase
MLAKALARSLDCSFSRLQFTPDLLPSDVTGVNVFNQKSNEFEFRPGPVFANLLLVDEINRASPKTQAALLECMQENQVTIDGVTLRARPPVHGRWRRRTRSSTRARIRCRRRSSTGSPCGLDRLPAAARGGADAHRADERAAARALEPVPGRRSARVVDEARAIFVEESLNRYVVALLRHTRSGPAPLPRREPAAGIALLRVAKARRSSTSATTSCPTT